MQLIRHITRRIKRVLLSNIGDNRQCPHCRHSFIPEDRTQQETINLYKFLFGPFKNKEKK